MIGHSVDFVDDMLSEFNANFDQQKEIQPTVLAQTPPVRSHWSIPILLPYQNHPFSDYPNRSKILVRYGWNLVYTVNYLSQIYFLYARAVYIRAVPDI